MLKIAVGLAIGAIIGAACRYFEVPVPAPPKLVGALLVVAITLGYIGTDWLMRPDAAEPNAATTAPSGDVAPRDDS